MSSLLPVLGLFPLQCGGDFAEEGIGDELGRRPLPLLFDRWGSVDLLCSPFLVVGGLSFELVFGRSPVSFQIF